MININRGHNAGLLEKCRPLYEYSWFIAKIREYCETVSIEEAADKALEEMPEDFGIKKYLVANREEVRMNILTEFDEEEFAKVIAEQSKEEGIEEGIEKDRAEVNDLNRWLREQGREEDLWQSLDDREYQDQLIEEMHAAKRELVDI